MTTTIERAPAPEGRRELNKERTRQALIEATYRLLHDEGPDALTAERVADLAGISRRTFFNYFPSVEAVIAYRATLVYEDLRAALTARPLSENLIDSAIAVIETFFTLEALTENVKTWRACQSSPAAARFALEAKSELIFEFAQEWAAMRLAGPGRPVDRIQVAVLTAASLAAYDVAIQQWLASHEGEVDARARRQLIDLVTTAFTTLRPSVDALRA